MKAMFEEYGGFIATTISAVIIVGLLFAILTPGTPINKAVVNLIMSAMP